MSSVRVRYQTMEFEGVDIHLRTLRDRQQFEDVDGVAEKLGISSATWPIFGVIWDSSEVLAHTMLDFDIAGKRILEVGCGIALSSLILNHRLADITATDYHPEVEGFLAINAALNGARIIPYIRTDWVDSMPSMGTFDLIIGSDLLYEREHAHVLSGFIDSHANPLCEVMIVDPGRGHQGRFSREMEAKGYTHSRSRPVTSAYLDAPYKGYIHSYQR